MSEHRKSLAARLVVLDAEIADREAEREEIRALLGNVMGRDFGSRLDGLRQLFADGTPRKMSEAMAHVGLSKRTISNGRTWYTRALGLVRVSRGVYRMPIEGVAAQGSAS